MFPIRDSEPSETRPFVTIALIAVNVLAFLYEISLEEWELHEFLMNWGAVSRRFEVVDLFTSMFLHGGLMHLIGNVWFLYIFGDNVEDILGHAKFLVFYLACGVAGGVLHLLFNGGSAVPAIGASGAISGVMGAYVLRFPHSRIQALIFLFISIEVPAYLMIGLWFATQIFSGVGAFAAAESQTGGTAWFAHIGGFLAGVILINVMSPRPRWRVRKEFQW